MTKRRDVAVLGATGLVGQTFVRLLAEHPWFRVTELVASRRSAGKPYGEAVSWMAGSRVPSEAVGIEVKGPDEAIRSRVVFSAVPGGAAGNVERAHAKAGRAVFTNARDLRMEPDVPLVVAEVNPEHLGLVEAKRREHAEAGFVVANGNCTTVTLVLTLKPILDAFGLERVSVVSLQALSGAGHPGVASMDAAANVIPYIPREEERLAMEAPRFLGTLRNGAVEPAAFRLAATCTRVPVVEGHTLVVTARTGRPTTPDAIRDAFASFSAKPQELGLPSAPPAPIIVRDEPDRPQPRLDESAGGGMAATVGRVAVDDVFEGVRYVAVASNLVRGAAGGSILNAELCAATDLLPG